MDDMQATVEYLKAKGIHVVWKPKVRGKHATAEIRDPNGYPLRHWFPVRA